MDSSDNDFGELYVDAKVQASDTFAGDVGFVKSCEESECATNSCKDKGFQDTVKPLSEGEMNKSGVVVAKDSCMCVDACAVNLTETNDEDSEFSDSEDDLNIVLKDDDSKPLPFARGSNTWCTMPNGSITMNASSNKSCIDPPLGMSQYGSSYSRTWSRTAFDVNIDELEKKPWRNPDADISDYFNFGFNEQSWKHYCKPLGRAIEVKGETLERIPSADLRRPRDLDPDVVIQISVTNDVEELSSMIPVKARSLSIGSNESSRSEDSHSNDGKDLNLVDDSIKDEAFVGCQDDKTRSFSGEQSPTENCCSRKVTPCDNDMIEKEKEELFCNSDESYPSSKERESSLGDRIRLSPASSCSVGKNEESDDYETESLKDNATDDQREVSTPPRRARLAEQIAISIKRGERSDTTQSRHRRSHEDSNKRHCGRAGYARHGSIQHRVVKDAWPTPGPVCDKKVRFRYGSSYRDSNKIWQHGRLITLEENEIERKGVHYSNREKYHGRLYPSLDHDRHREHKIDWRNNKASSVDRGFGHSTEYISRSYFHPNQRNSRSSFKEEDDRYGWHHCERVYDRERSPVRAYEYNRERNGYDWLREPYYEDCIPNTDMDYWYQSGYSFAHEIHNLKQSPEKDLHCRRRGDYDYDLHRHRYEDGCHRAESRISYELAYREMHSFAEMGRREYQGYKSHEEFSEIDQRHHHTNDWHLDRFISEKDGRMYRTQDAWPSSSWSLRDSKNTRDVRTAESYDSQNNRLYKAASRDDWTQNLGRSDNVGIRDRRLKHNDDWVRPNGRRNKLADYTPCARREVAHSENPSYIDEILVRDIRIPAQNRIFTKQRSRDFKSHIRERHDGSKKLRGDGHAFNKCQDPVATVMSRVKLSNQSKKGFSNGEDTIEQQDGWKPSKVICRSEEKAMQIQDLNDKEEGEIIEEAWNVRGGEIDNERIQESLKKMVKRRARFKETKFARRTEAIFESQTKPRAKTDVTDQQRPVRKRRWCAT